MGKKYLYLIDRGGSWHDVYLLSKIPHRDHYESEVKSYELGFRVVRTVGVLQCLAEAEKKPLKLDFSHLLIKPKRKKRS